MSRRNFRGFTLVELLVVITIIAMLMALLLPAVMSARMRARQTQCLNNEREVTLGILQYESQKQQFPGTVKYNPNAANGWITWTMQIFPFIGRADLYAPLNAGPNQTVQPVKIEVLVCPAKTPTGTPAPLSFVVNTGRKDDWSNYQKSPPIPGDWPENGVFMNQWYAPTAGLAPIQTTSLSFISKHDGTANTTMLSENLDCMDWTVPSPEPVSGINWFLDPPPLGLNKLGGQGDPNNAGTYFGYARPSSTHSGGFNMAFCDGRVVFISDEIEYRVYALLMTPWGAQAREPGTMTATTYPAAWTLGGNVLRPLNDTDIK